MVRPSSPEPTRTTEATIDASNEGVNSGLSEGVAGHSRSTHGLTETEEALRNGLGPGFSLRRSGSSPTPFEQSGEEGAALYRNFLAEEFRRRNLPQPADYLTRDSAYNRIPEPTSGDLLRAGAQLRLLSNEFAQSPLRLWVEEQAARVPLDGLDFDSFSELLYGLFQEGGVTWERVVVLFHFCADLAVRAFREKLPQQFYNIVDWSFRYIAGEKMLRWVAENGGWVKCLQKSVDHAYKIARIGFFAMGILAFAAYIWKSR